MKVEEVGIEASHFLFWEYNFQYCVFAVHSFKGCEKSGLSKLQIVSSAFKPRNCGLKLVQK
jgi:hypothetical protein